MNKALHPVTAIGIFFFCLLPASCPAPDSSGQPVIPNQWTWVLGSDIYNQVGVYGTKGLAAPANIPGARESSTSCSDSSGNLWLFGGYGEDNHELGYLNDLWRFDGTNWTWVSGSNNTNQNGAYGVKGTADQANIPGARMYSVSWLDASGAFWLFGGLGFDSAGSLSHLNDLWKFDGTSWTWMSGSNLANQIGVYGTKGTADPANTPGTKTGAVGWHDAANNLWLFGGEGYDGAGNYGGLNDLWKFDGTNWTWISGSNAARQQGAYGTKGVAAPANIPGARSSSVSWIDSGGNLWLFAGDGIDGTGNSGRLNDLWKFDGLNWTWMSGSNTTNQSGTYGVKGVADSANMPGGRSWSKGWIDATGNLWIFGGIGRDGSGGGGYLNDLWKYDGTNWTWVSGANAGNQTGTYGVQGVADSSNMPGSRSSYIVWTDASGALWLFGGSGYDSTGSDGYLNDLWRYRP